MSETEQAQIEALRRREDAEEALGLPEAAQLAAFYAQVEAEEEARLAPRREAEREKRRRYLAELEAILTQKRESLQRLELLVREIETLDQKESRLRATVQGGVLETEYGATLTIDHYQPVSRGGTGCTHKLVGR